MFDLFGWATYKKTDEKDKEKDKRNEADDFCIMEDPDHPGQYIDRDGNRYDSDYTLID